MPTAYGWQHQKRRAAWAKVIAESGPIRCECDGQCLEHDGQCETLIYPGDEWHLAHVDGGVRNGDDGSTSAPWCTRCNLVDAANVTNGKYAPGTPSRNWWA